MSCVIEYLRTAPITRPTCRSLRTRDHSLAMTQRGGAEPYRARGVTWVQPHPYRGEPCHYCGDYPRSPRPRHRFRACAACRPFFSVTYCSNRCCRDDWDIHRLACFRYDPRPLDVMDRALNITGPRTHARPVYLVLPPRYTCRPDMSDCAVLDTSVAHAVSDPDYVPPMTLSRDRLG